MHLKVVEELPLLSVSELSFCTRDGTHGFTEPAYKLIGISLPIAPSIHPLSFFIRLHCDTASSLTSS